MADIRFVRPYGEYHPTCDGYPTTVAEMVLQRRESWPDKPFLKGRYGAEDELKTFSGAEYTRRALAVNARLRELGLKKGDHVGLLSHNQPGWPIAYGGIILNGIVVVPIDHLLTPDEYTSIIQRSGVRVLICERKVHDDIAGRREEFPRLERLINLDDWELVDPDAAIEEPEAPSETPDPEDDLAILFTSGTTGSSKIVKLLHRNVAFNVKQLHYAMYTGPMDNFLSVLPLFHTFECTCGFMIQLFGGSTILYAKRINSRDLLRDMREGEITMMLGVPLLFEKLYKGIRSKLKQQPLIKRLIIGLLYGLERFGRLFGARWGKGLFRSLREKAGLGSIRTFVSGAAALAPEVARGFERLGIICTMGYGLTECSPTTNLNYNGERLAAPDSVGPIHFASEQCIDNPNENGEGEICVRGPQVTGGYLDNEQANREAFFEMETPPEAEHRQGSRLLYKAGDELETVRAAHPAWYTHWFRTGDIGWIGADGGLRISGRLKNVIVTAAGKNVYPEELEEYFVDCPLLAEYIVTGRRLPEGNREDVVLLALPDWEHLRERAADEETEADEAYVRRLLEAEIKAVNGKLASYKQLKDLYLRGEAFPRTSTGKIKRYLVGLDDSGIG